MEERMRNEEKGGMKGGKEEKGGNGRRAVGFK
jgi:hypothetical protein